MFSKFKINSYVLRNLSNKPFFPKHNFATTPNTSIMISINDDEKANALCNYVLRFETRKIKQSEDSLIIDASYIGKISNLSTITEFPVFESIIGNKIYLNIGTFLLMLIPAFIFFYYTLKWLRARYRLYQKEICGKLSLLSYTLPVIVSSILLYYVMANPIYKLWRIVKKIELSKDLKMLKFTTFSNKVFTTEISNVYFLKNKISTYYSYKTFKKVSEYFTIGIKDQFYYIPIKNSKVNKDLFNLCVRGYKLKF